MGARVLIQDYWKGTFWGIMYQTLLGQWMHPVTVPLDTTNSVQHGVVMQRHARITVATGLYSYHQIRDLHGISGQRTPQSPLDPHEGRYKSYRGLATLRLVTSKPWGQDKL